MSTFDLELFNLHLASHLMGAECVKQKLHNRVESRLYWKTPLLLDVDPETKRPVQISGRKILLFDATFELNPSKETMISMHWGVLVVEGDQSRHFSTKNLTLTGLEQHFGKLDIDVQSTPEPALAKTMSQALKAVTTAKPLLATDPISVSLYYQDLDQSADLTIQPSNDGSNVPSSVLDMIILNLANDTTGTYIEKIEGATNDEELASMLQHWREDKKLADSASRARTAEATTATQATKPSPESSPKEASKENGTSPESQSDKKVVKIKGKSRQGPFRPGAAKKKKKAKLTFAGE